MSLLIAIPATDGVVLAAESSLTVGQVTRSTDRVQFLNRRICWAGTGELALIQKVTAALEDLGQSEKGLAELYQPIGNSIKTSVRELLMGDFRTDFYINNLQAISQLHRANFVFVESQPTPRIVHISSTGLIESVEGHPFIVGPGDTFAGSLIKRYLDLELDIQLATVLASRILHEVIDAGVQQLSGPIDIWQVTPSGPRRLSAEELAGVQDTVASIYKHEVAVFEQHLTQSLSH